MDRKARVTRKNVADHIYSIRNLALEIGWLWITIIKALVLEGQTRHIYLPLTTFIQLPLQRKLPAYWVMRRMRVSISQERRK